MELKIEYKHIDDLIPYEKNPRNNKEAIKYVKNSIKQFGFKNPVIIDKNNVIVCGHTRVSACKELKINKIPCIYADDLTDEQIKAFRLADNKVSEIATWDNELLEDELNDIFDIDMEDFGFDVYDEELEHETYKEETQRRVENILNLERSQFKGEGEYDIPMMEPVYKLEHIDEWIGFNYVLSDDSPEHKGVHFFIDDYQFERVWNNPDKYIEKLKQYACVVAPDFSPYGDMPLATQIFNHYRKHWVACYFQQRGVTVIPCIRASTDERSLDFYLDGTPKNSIVCISNMWANNDNEKLYFEREFGLMKEKLNPSKIFVYGKPMNLEGNIEYIKTFTEKRWNNG